jgi:hypothetical protein
MLFLLQLILYPLVYCSHRFLHIAFSTSNIDVVVLSVDMRIIFENFDGRRMHIYFDVELFLNFLFNFETTTTSKQRMVGVFDPFNDLTNSPLLWG